MDTVIRDATVADAAAIASVHVRSWRSAYRGMIAATVLDGLSISARASDWTVRLGRARSQGATPFTLVGERDGELLGFCNVTRLDEDAEATIGALYVEPGHLRTGLGSVLLWAALDALHTAGVDDVVLWVLEANVAARAFYERFDFHDDGARERSEGASEIRMRVSLTSSGLFAGEPQEL